MKLFYRPVRGLYRPCEIRFSQVLKYLFPFAQYNRKRGEGSVSSPHALLRLLLFSDLSF